MNEDYINGLLDQMFRQAQAQFGKAVKAHWFHNGDTCPGCGG